MSEPQQQRQTNVHELRPSQVTQSHNQQPQSSSRQSRPSRPPQSQHQQQQQTNVHRSRSSQSPKPQRPQQQQHQTKALEPNALLQSSSHHEYQQKPQLQPQTYQTDHSQRRQQLCPANDQQKQLDRDHRQQRARRQQEISEERNSQRRSVDKHEDSVVEDRLDTRQRTNGQQQHRRFQRSSGLMMDIDGLPPFESGTLAHTMRVDNMTINYGMKSNENPVAPSTNSLVDQVSDISSEWKKQADALSLTPAEQLEFYRRQYDRLTKVLCIALFNEPPSVIPSTSDTTDVKVKDPSGEQDSITQTVHSKKHNTTPSCERECIIFEQNNKYLHRRVDMVKRYAKRMKIPRYIRIVGNNETKNPIACLKAADPTFVDTKTIHFVEGQSLSELCEEIKKRFDGMSLENEPNVEYCEEDPDAELKEPPVKKMKTSPKKPNKTSSSSKNTTSKDEQNTRPSGVEMNTDSEEEEYNNEDGKIGKGKKEASEDSDSSSDSSVSDTDSSVDDNDQVVVPTASNAEPYIPATKTDPSSIPVYVPTSKTSANKSLPDMPPIQHLVDIDKKHENPPSPLFPDSNAVSKKRKHRDREHERRQ